MKEWKIRKAELFSEPNEKQSKPEAAYWQRKLKEGDEFLKYQEERGEMQVQKYCQFAKKRERPIKHEICKEVSDP